VRAFLGGVKLSGMKWANVKVTSFASVVALLIGSVWAQSDSQPYSRAAAEKSFRALVAAKDTDIIDLIKSDGLVCFADSLPYSSTDRFLTIDLPKPGDWAQDTTSITTPDEKGGSFYDGKTEFPATSPAILVFREWENQDWSDVVYSGIEGMWHSYGHYQRAKAGQNEWKAFTNISPVFRFAKDKDELTSATNIRVMEDGSIFNASKTFANQNKGTTSYEMNMRLSTGRYTETWTPDKGDAMKSVGNCYNAKKFASVTPVITKKAK
jgi:hypothetical protein